MIIYIYMNISDHNMECEIHGLTSLLTITLNEYFKQCYILLQDDIIAKFKVVYNAIKAELYVRIHEYKEFRKWLINRHDSSHLCSFHEFMNKSTRFPEYLNNFSDLCIEHDVLYYCASVFERFSNTLTLNYRNNFMKNLYNFQPQKKDLKQGLPAYFNGYRVN
jgi:hypothetical protein